MANDWSREEVEATVSDYFDMLACELDGKPFNKAEHNRNLRKLLNNRSHSAVELKHQNITAILLELGFPFIDGYKPLTNYQQLLFDAVADRLEAAPALHQAAARIVEQQVESRPLVNNLLEILVEPPHLAEETVILHDELAKANRLPKRNYLEMEARNHALGLAGEHLVLEYEQKRLWQAGRRDLANRIDHFSQTRGDGLGFDISSFETDGREKLIEVKTTRFGKQTPFFASKNEVTVSAQREQQYHLYRLFHFSKQPRLFILPGSLRDSCALDPTQFSAQPR